MSKDCRYICQRAANAIMSEVGPYRSSTDALLGVNQFLDEFLIQLLVDCQSLDLSRIKTSVFRLIPSTLGKNAIVEAELEVKTFTEVEFIDYDIYERMRTLGQTADQPFPIKKCFLYLRDRCFEFCTLADKEDQQSWPAQKECQDLIISPIVAIYVTTVLEHLAEYVLTAMALTAEIEETELIRIKELFLTLVDDLQVGMVFQSMNLRDKLEKRSFAHSYVSRSCRFPRSSTPNSQDILRGSTYSVNSSNSYLDETSFDGLNLHYADKDETNASNLLGPHTSFSNYSVSTGNSRQSTPLMTGNTSSDNSKKAYKVFKSDYALDNDSLSFEQSPFSVYDPDSSMNFEELIRSGNTMRVSLTPDRLKSIEVKDQMMDDPIPSKSAWKRRSSSVPRMSRRSSGFGLSTPSSSCIQVPSSLAMASSIATKTGTGYAATLYDVDLKNYGNTRRPLSQSRVTCRNESKPLKSKSTKLVTRPENRINASKKPSIDTTPTLIEKTLPTPTSSTSSNQSKKHYIASLEVKGSSSSSSIAHSTNTISTHAGSDTNPSNSILSETTTPAVLPPKLTSKTVSAASIIDGESNSSAYAKFLRQNSFSDRKCCENLRLPRENPDESSPQHNVISSTDDNSPVVSDKTKHRITPSPIDKEPDLTPLPTKLPHKPETQSNTLNDRAGHLHHQTSSCSTLETGKMGADGQDSMQQIISDPEESQGIDHCDDKIDPSPICVSITTTSYHRPSLQNRMIDEDFGIGLPDSNNQYQPKPTTRRTIAAGAVGNTIKRLDQVVKQKPPSTDSPIVIAPVSRQQLLNTPSTTQQKAASRRSAVLDKVLQFERAYSMDDVTQRRASSYIPRRERFMYLQYDHSALERPMSKLSAATSSVPHGSHRYGVRSGAIAAAAARFETGKSVAVQTDNAVQHEDRRKMGDGDSMRIMAPLMPTNNTRSGVPTNKSINALDGSSNGAKERLLPANEWEDGQRQESAVVSWILGES